MLKKLTDIYRLLKRYSRSAMVIPTRSYSMVLMRPKVWF